MAQWVYKNRASAVLYEYLQSFGEGHRVAVPANVCPIVLATLFKAQAKIIVVDLSEHDYLMDLTQLRGVLSQLNGASVSVLFVRTYGFLDDQSTNFSSLKSEFPNVSIIDDRCLCPPEFDASTFSPTADLTLFSTGYSKFVELGRGGFGFTHSDYWQTADSVGFVEQDHQDLIKQFTHCLSGQDSFRYKESDWLDLQSPLHTFAEYKQEVISLQEQSLQQKKRINDIYFDKLIHSESVSIFSDGYHDWRFNILVKNKQRLLEAIFAEGFFASSHYASINPGFIQALTPVADRLHNHIVNLFNDFRIAEESAVKIADIVLRECENG